MVDLLAASEPTEPVGEFRYHYLTYGWLVGGIAERVVARPLTLALALALAALAALAVSLTTAPDRCF